MQKLFFILAIVLSIPFSAIAQDSVRYDVDSITIISDSSKTIENNLLILKQKQKTLDSLKKIPFDEFKILNPYQFNIKSDTIGNQQFLWNDKRNLSEILNEQPGYLINYFAYGGRNLINYNGFNDKQIGIFRDGLQINDFYFGGFEIENISVNEIQKIESITNVMSFLYGYNTYGKALNIITKDVFIPYIFTQLRYSMDRFDALNADINFNIPFSRKINFILGANSSATDGRYKNNDFSVWRFRSRLNYFQSNKLNIKFDFNYSFIQRGLFEGLYPAANDTLSNNILATSRNTDSYEKLYKYNGNIVITAKPIKEGLTILSFTTNNSLREYRDEENRVPSNKKYINNNFHSIQYSADLKQYLSLHLGKNIKSDFLAGGNVSFNIHSFNLIDPDTSNYNNSQLFSYNLSNNFYSAFSRLNLEIFNFEASGGFRVDLIDGNTHIQYGAEGGINIPITEENKIKIYGGFNTTTNGINYYALIYPTYMPDTRLYSGEVTQYFETGLKFINKTIIFDIKQYASNKSGEFKFGNINSSFNLLTKYFEGNISFDRFNFDNYPAIFLKTDFCYHDYFFANHLNIKFGINFKFASNFIPLGYDQYRNIYLTPPYISIEKNFVNLDFYVGAKIGSANLTFTFANLLNNLNYTTALFPYDERGGLFNTWARASITWDFKY